jgi:hypothetical protein
LKCQIEHRISFFIKNIYKKRRKSFGAHQFFLVFPAPSTKTKLYLFFSTHRQNLGQKQQIKGKLQKTFSIKNENNLCVLMGIAQDFQQKNFCVFGKIA